MGWTVVDQCIWLRRSLWSEFVSHLPRPQLLKVATNSLMTCQMTTRLRPNFLFGRRVVRSSTRIHFPLCPTKSQIYLLWSVEFLQPEIVLFCSFKLGVFRPRERQARQLIVRRVCSSPQTLPQNRNPFPAQRNTKKLLRSPSVALRNPIAAKLLSHPKNPKTVVLETAVENCFAMKVFNVYMRLFTMYILYIM